MVAKNTAPGSGSRPATAVNGRGATKARPKSSGGPGDRVARRVGAPSLGTFFQESRAELAKVTWPTRQETMNLTGAVIAFTLGLAAFLGLIDEIVTLLFKPIFGG